ncbi:TIGR00266 family protein [Haloarcula sp. CBA1130]|uniref:TIGR00266 family protein n=1 Tax=unclassified Haloarcula TaxID=2624677 RepID=UPI0012489077|nr:MULTISPECIES: TIGR00266 family protein [unclassified Haloarcula]KAA9396934.1 TIGR00266 family protein [Haloarcula sp. CBA1129]KAA9403028.1 TIGR00266 family protein [Haloarcula sp. CBA1130]
MDIELTHKPSYTHVRADLDSGESILAEPGAMVSHSPTIEIETTTSRDGLLSSAKSMLGGESLLANEFTAQGGSGTVTLAPPTPGDVHHHELTGETLYAVDGAFLASDPDIDIDSEFGGVKSLLAGASITPLALKGTGNVLIEAFGGLETVELDAGESYTIDNDHVVAWEESVKFDAHRVGGLKSTLLSGEGLVMDFTGPGTVWYQTRGLDSFTSAIADALPGTGDNDGDASGLDDFI